ncbi:MAG TPA: CaiB/BaiF CoA-transferase family protein [Burkholderiaceae bacterium]|jgi:formyl-CoA transferase|nr:CaiB/BaiF CoA-transferase family protein [Burkholderiaceae bacterium]
MTNSSLNTHTPFKKALGHVRVLDLTRVLAGPWCAQNLADLGADVIKIERPGAGDDTRSWGPPYLRDAQGRDTTEAAYYLAANRGKRSLTLDIASAEGQAIVRDLAKHCDVVLENYKVGQLKKYGLDYESLRREKPDLIYCSITGFGQDGPYAQRAGYDFIVQGMGGFMSITGERDDLPGGGPQKAGIAISDLMTGMYATIAVMAALTHRDRTGEGQYIDMALLDVQVAMLANMDTNYLASGEPPKRWGNAHPNIVPYQTFATSDGHIIVAVGNDGQYQKFVAVGGRPELAADERFATNPMRVRHRDILVPLLAEMVRTRTKQQWIDLLEAAGVPCGPINNLDEVFVNPQVAARKLRIDLPHPTGGTVKLVGSPMKLSATPPRYDMPPPLLGQHTEEVLRDVLGHNAAQIAALREKGII